MGIDYLKERGFVRPTQHTTVNKNTSRNKKYIQLKNKEIK